MSLYFLDHELPGSARWCRAQSDEERGHALKIFDHVVKRRAKGGMVSHKGEIEAGWTSPVGVWEKALQLEIDNSNAILELVKHAREEGDFTSEGFLMWYVNEQVEEESAVKDILENAKQVIATTGLYVTYDAQIAQKQR
ncbi:hypothetical protein HDU85_002119 [Gaertneriomyces sp. JEL0708]|nr:hypothetical protein HDU85_002119 [Gaertneriomyces sp. JEL0708]